MMGSLSDEEKVEYAGLTSRVYALRDALGAAQSVADRALHGTDYVSDVVAALRGLLASAEAKKDAWENALPRS